MVVVVEDLSAQIEMTHAPSAGTVTVGVVCAVAVFVAPAIANAPTGAAVDVP